MIPLVWASIVVEPACFLLAVKEKLFNPPHKVISLLTLNVESTIVLFLILVLPPWPAIVKLDALVAKSTIVVALLSPKKDTFSAVDLMNVVSPAPRLVMLDPSVLSLTWPSRTSPAILNSLLLTCV